MTHWTVKSGRKRKDNCITVVLCVLQHYFVSNKWKKLYIFRHRFAGKMETFESILLIKQEVFVYKIPPAGNNRKHRWAFSMASEKQKTTIGFYLSKFAMSEFFFCFRYHLHKNSQTTTKNHVFIFAERQIGISVNHCGLAEWGWLPKALPSIWSWKTRTRAHCTPIAQSKAIQVRL